jgi:hypothetical protein
MTTKSYEQQLEEVDSHIEAIINTLRRPEINQQEEQEGCALLARAIVIKAFLTSKGKPNGKDNS